MCLALCLALLLAPVNSLRIHGTHDLMRLELPANSPFSLDAFDLDHGLLDEDPTDLEDSEWDDQRRLSQAVYERDIRLAKQAAEEAEATDQDQLTMRFRETKGTPRTQQAQLLASNPADAVAKLKKQMEDIQKDGNSAEGRLQLKSTGTEGNTTRFAVTRSFCQ